AVQTKNDVTPRTRSAYDSSNRFSVRECFNLFNKKRENPMKTKVCLLLICMFAVAGLALAQAKVDGKWTAEIQGGRGPQMVTITLKNDGGKLTGTVEGGRGGAIP